MKCLLIFILSALCTVTEVKITWATDWISLLPNPAYTRDLSMGGSTVAELYAPQNAGINPAGFSLFGNNSQKLSTTILINPGGLWKIKNYFEDKSNSYSVSQKAFDASRLLIHGAAFESNLVTLAALLTEPVMKQSDVYSYYDFENQTSLASHQNSVLMKLNLHSRVALGGRMDAYYSENDFQGEAYSYGLILSPKNLNVGVQYQSFPMNNARIWHPLDRRSNGTTSAGFSVTPKNLTINFQVMNLTQSNSRIFLEPHAGVEWRPVRAVALRAGGMQFSKSPRWVATAGFSLFDANWLRDRTNRLIVPDDIIQFAIAIIYNKKTPELGISSLTLAWRL